jgi:hypothetical protein
VKLIRSFPADPPANRNYVVDDADRIYNANYDYSPLADIHDDIIQLDWDTAVSRGDLVRFAEAARREPGRVLVAPVPIYPDDYPGLPPPYVWNCRSYVGEGPGRALRYVDEWEPECDLFGFGMVYLPRAMIYGFLETGWGFDDTSFASWYQLEHGPSPIAWDVRPIHLHYRISEVV